MLEAWDHFKTDFIKNQNILMLLLDCEMRINAEEADCILFSFKISRIIKR